MRKLVVSFAVLFLLLSLGPGVALAEKPDNPKPLNPRVLEAVFIHYEHPGPDARPAGKPTPTPETKVYDYYLLLGPKWDLGKYLVGVPYTINPSNAPLGAEGEVKLAFEAWDAATLAELFSDTPTINYNAWWGREDGRNNVSWQLIAGYPNVIAGTWIWYYDNDNNGTMTLGDTMEETDIVFNLGSIKWGIDPDDEGPTKIKNFDVQNIATHEVGHVVGLDDLYESKYSEITMYGYSSKGETKKISLEVGDILGTQAIYGGPLGL